MLIKMKESKGFTLVELMIVVAIIGILAAVAVPFYQRYVAKSRLTSLVLPGVHAVETNLSSFYSVKGTWPSSFNSFDRDADTTCFNLTWPTSIAGDSFEIRVDLDTTDAKCSGLKTLKSDFGGFTVKAKIMDQGKLEWKVTGRLAEELGL